MKRFLFLLLLGSCSVLTVSAQFRPTDDFFDIPILIECGRYSGSGALFADSQYVYLVTAKHVLFDMNTNKNHGAVIMMRYYTSKLADTSAVRLDANLDSLIRYSAAQFSDVGDVAIVALGNHVYHETNWHFVPFKFVTRSGSTGITHIIREADTRLFHSIHMGDDAIIIGYPKSLDLIPGEYDFNKPLLRKGTIAGMDQRHQRIILDCPANKGNSGGPVYGFDIQDRQLKFIGVVSMGIFAKETSYDDSTKKVLPMSTFVSSGYSIIEPIDKILSLVRKVKGDIKGR